MWKWLAEATGFGTSSAATPAAPAAVLTPPADVLFAGGPTLAVRVAAAHVVVNGQSASYETFPREVWMLILGELTDASTLFSVSLVSKRMRAYVVSSRAWSTLLDARFGAGTSAVMAESALALQRFFTRAIAPTRAEVEDARAAFYRRARCEFMRLTIQARIQKSVQLENADVHCFRQLRSPDGQEIDCVPVESFFAGAACLLDTVAIVLIPYASLAQLQQRSQTGDALAAGTLALVRVLNERPFCWSGVVPVMLWQAVVDAKAAANGVGFPALLTVRAFGRRPYRNAKETSLTVAN